MNLVIKAPSGAQVFRAEMDLMVRKENKESLVPLAQQDPLAPSDQLATLVCKDSMDQLDLQDLREILESLEEMESVERE